MTAMKLGTFSLSLNVKDIDKSLDFYQKLGFSVIDGGHVSESFKDSDKMKWRIVAHESLKIGLFQGMFDDNILTFNGVDVLAIQKHLKSEGINFLKEASADEMHISAMLSDPDENIVLLEKE